MRFLYTERCFYFQLPIILFKINATLKMCSTISPEWSPNSLPWSCIINRHNKHRWYLPKEKMSRWLSYNLLSVNRCQPTNMIDSHMSAWAIIEVGQTFQRSEEAQMAKSWFNKTSCFNQYSSLVSTTIWPIVSHLWCFSCITCAEHVYYTCICCICSIPCTRSCVLYMYLLYM